MCGSGFKKWYEQHKYCLWLLYFGFYLAAFYLLEKMEADYHIIHCKWDAYIPFCEWFVIPYVLWFAAVPTAILYFLFHSKEDFVNLCALMFTGMTICLALYALVPNGIELRAALPADNFACRLVALIRQLDPPVNVCPSIHCTNSVSIAIAVNKSKTLGENHKVCRAVNLLMGLICLSTMFIKQHSVVDVVCGVTLTFGLSLLIYGTQWKVRLAKTRLAVLVR